MTVSSPAYEIAQWLVASLPALGPLHGTDPWSVHVASEPDEPANVVTLYDTMGLPHDTDELDIMRPSIQVRVRSAPGDYDLGYRLHHLIKTALIHSKIEAETTSFQLITLTSDFASIGRDERGRHLGVSNYQCHRVARTANKETDNG